MIKGKIILKNFPYISLTCRLWILKQIIFTSPNFSCDLPVKQLIKLEPLTFKNHCISNFTSRKKNMTRKGIAKLIFNNQKPYKNSDFYNIWSLICSYMIILFHVFLFMLYNKKHIYHIPIFLVVWQTLWIFLSLHN